MHEQFLGWCADVIGISRVRFELVLGLVGLASITQAICSQNVWQLLGLRTIVACESLSATHCNL